MTEEEKRAIDRACKMKLPVRRYNVSPSLSEDEHAKRRDHSDGSDVRQRIARYVRVSTGVDESNEGSEPA